jgi:hypothetical protein
MKMKGTCGEEREDLPHHMVPLYRHRKTHSLPNLNGPIHILRTSHPPEAKK